MSQPLQQPTLLSTHSRLYFPQSKTLTLIHHRRQINPMTITITNTNFPTNQLPFSLRRVEKSSVVRSSVKGSKNEGRKQAIDENGDNGGFVNGVVKIGLWVLEGVYITWLFLLPFAPGDPVWAISSETISSLIGLSLNFFFILPLSNADVPYKQLNQADDESSPTKLSQLGTLMIKGAPTVGLVGGGVCLISILWALIGRGDTGFGTITERLDFLLSYLGSERLAYAFIWDIVLYTIFQPWLIGENLNNVEENRVDIVNYLRFIPVVGLAAYLICLKTKPELDMVDSGSND